MAHPLSKASWRHSGVVESGREVDGAIVVVRDRGSSTRPSGHMSEVLNASLGIPKLEEKAPALGVVVLQEQALLVGLGAVIV